MRRPVLVAAVVAIAAAATAAEAAGPALTAKVFPKPVILNHPILVSGHLSSGQSGKQVVLETQKFPFTGTFHQAATTTTGPSGDYVFTHFKPRLATRVQVHLGSNPSVKSSTPTAYVIAEYAHIHCVIRQSGKDHGCTKPPNGDQTIHFDFHLRFPASAYNAEAVKPVYVYFGLRTGSTQQPDTDKLRKTVNQTKLGNNETAVNVAYSFHAPNGKWAYHLATCIKFTEAADGLGLPGNHHCGDPTVSRQQAGSTTFG
jgi:hypothetical protein